MLITVKVSVREVEINVSVDPEWPEGVCAALLHRQAVRLAEVLAWDADPRFLVALRDELSFLLYTEHKGRLVYTERVGAADPIVFDSEEEEG